MNITQESLEVPNKQAKYTNRYGDVYTFTKQEDGSVLWEGNFEYSRIGYDKDPSDPIFVDPSGGPFIKKGQMLAHIVYDNEFNVIIDGFEGKFVFKPKTFWPTPNFF